MKPLMIRLFILILAGVGVACGPFTAELDEPKSSNTNGLNIKSDAVATCSVKDNQDGTFTMTCPDGTSATWKEGTDGLDGNDGKDGSNGQDGKDGLNGKDGENGKDGSSCNVIDNGDNTYTMTCTDGTSVTFQDGKDGANGVDGSSCGVTDNGNGSYSMACTNGSAVTWSNAGTAPTLLPSGLLTGSYTIENSLDIAFLQGVTWVTGSLTISADGVMEVKLPKLQGVGGVYAIRKNDTLTSFPVIVHLGGLELVGNPKLTEVSLPVTSVSRHIAISSNERLVSLHLPAISSIGGALTNLFEHRTHRLRDARTQLDWRRPSN